ncbi:GDSL esterase/lipase-like [Iris pallida]|uniref:GDSL esterase/lipase-like n=1 Tax=Iris pallida TaxID=29817 RepID=A0AAX6FCN7_IRIPA|nr:GDSL esterase/lipase-like [Iris pallida]
MEPFLVSLILLLLLPLHGSSSPPCNFPAIFNFGDSNSDTGAHSSAFGPALPPNGETFSVQPAGRYSDGRLLIDLLAESLGLPYLSAYLDSVGTNFSHGANFAALSSTINDQNETFSRGGYSPFTLGVQLQEFTQFKYRSQLYFLGGVFMELMPKEEYFSRALYTIDIGQNDLTQGYSAKKPAEEFIPDTIGLLTTAIKSIYDEGGRHFWIHNTGPLGCLSYTLAATRPVPSEFDSVGCAVRFNELAQQFNRMLNETVAKLREDLPLATFAYVDVYSVKYLLVSQAEKYGFEHTFTACCGYGGGAYNYDGSKRCGFRTEINGTEVLMTKPCEDPSKRILWDGIHYSEAANRWIFDRISNGEFSYPPTSPISACHGGKMVVTEKGKDR